MISIRIYKDIPLEMILNMAKMAIGKKDRTNGFLKKVA